MTNRNIMIKVGAIYNKKQDAYKIKRVFDSETLIIMDTQNESTEYISVYEFLYNPKWNFAKTFFGEKEWEQKVIEMVIKEPFAFLSRFIEEAPKLHIETEQGCGKESL